MGKKGKNPAAVLLGRLSGVARGTPPGKDMIRLTDAQKHKAAVAFGRLGGLKGGSRGGIARAKKLNAEERRTIALNAIRTRWEKRKLRSHVAH